MEADFEMLRGERRSFFCPNRLWKELKTKTDNCMSVSQYIKQAVIEKMKKEDPQRKEYYESLLFND